MKLPIISGLLFAAALSFITVSSCGKKGNDDDATQAPVTPAAPKTDPKAPEAPLALTFIDNIGPIVAQKCAPCHSDGNKAPYFVGHEDVFKANADSIAASITSTAPDKVMPKKVKPRVLEESEKAIILAFLGQDGLETGGTRIDFTETVNPILTVKCAKCHGAEGREPFFIGNEAIFREETEDVVRTITSTDPLIIMPKPAIQKVLTDDEKAKLLRFLGK